MKKTTFILTVSLFIVFTACNKRRSQYEKVEREYDELFKKEYPEFIDSERYKAFDERYKLLCRLSKEVNTSENIIVHSMPIDTICVEPPLDIQVLNSNYEEPSMEDDFEIKVLPFSSYINSSSLVNAVLVAQDFYRPSDKYDQFENETDIHEAHRMLDAKSYVLTHINMQSTNEYIYHDFCKKKILTDNINHAKYIVVLKSKQYVPWEFLSQIAESDYLSGKYEGTLYVYDVLLGKFVKSITIVAMNSDEVEGIKYDFTNALDRDMNNNVVKSIHHGLAPHTGYLPFLSMNSTLHRLNSY
jgi:hypothetical protein